jgi:uncharacterized membrane protein
MMKLSDIDKIHNAGLISAEQRQQIIDRFKLREDKRYFQAIISIIGAVLVVAGIVLLISANWNEIHRYVKIALGMASMLGAHAGGYYLRRRYPRYEYTGEALHLAGSALFLGNIALVGQIYNLSSRPPNAILLWWVGIAALPWLLRSKAQHILFLLAFGLWFGLETNQRDSWIYFSDDESQIMLYALLGMFYFGAGLCLRKGRFGAFASSTEKLGLLAFHFFAYPLTWGLYSYMRPEMTRWQVTVFLGLALLALAAIGFGLRREMQLDFQWRETWGAMLVGGVGLLVASFFLLERMEWQYRTHGNRVSWLASAVLFIFCLLQIKVGVQLGSRFLINLGIAFVALNILSTYLTLIGSMALTGVTFLLSGLFLLGFGIYLVSRQRALIQRVKAKTAGGNEP